ncbi:FAD assembly factor SdhE [Defluviicoccus vanus]|uniref:FAD assembly factor SdhE n=1 Tax=Defluviicoccus vanus TaxID=111831 RepID=A0A7H1MZ45_9PROT|nr:succinate dehydrogenase assembly factor 2 [Defluviicoccus vanus]QNT68731.1 succinate dehydrogenase assembly factor 2 [Defluviicoccus vanus]
MVDTAETRRKRVVFRSHHTGMKENDILFGAFVDRHLPSLSDAEVEWLERLLMDHNDIDLNAWMTGKTPYPPELEHPVMQRLLNFQYIP